MTEESIIDESVPKMAKSFEELRGTGLGEYAAIAQLKVSNDTTLSFSQ